MIKYDRTLLQNVSGITKCDRSLLQIVSGITKCDRSLLKSASGVLQSVSGIMKCDRLLLQSASGNTKCNRLLLQSASGITKYDSYYKLRRNTCEGNLFKFQWQKIKHWDKFLFRLGLVSISACCKRKNL